MYFAICAITGPVAGVAIGGIAFARLGGFENHQSFPLAVSIMSFGAIIAFPLPLVNTIGLSFGLLWF